MSETYPQRITRAMADLIIAHDTGGEPAWVVEPFVWLARPGTDYLNPTRLVLDSVVTAGPEAINARAIGPGVNQVLAAVPIHVERDPDGRLAWEARWRLFEIASHLAAKAVRKSHWQRVREIASLTNGSQGAGAVLDDLQFEAITDELMLAEGGAFERICRLVLSPTRFTRVNPVTWLESTIYREAWQAVGRAMGDVRPGPRIRRIAHARGLTDHHEIASAFNESVTSSHRITPDLAAKAIAVMELPQLPLSLDRGWDQ